MSEKGAGGTGGVDAVAAECRANQTVEECKMDKRCKYDTKKGCLERLQDNDNTAVTGAEGAGNQQQQQNTSRSTSDSSSQQPVAGAAQTTAGGVDAAAAGSKTQTVKVCISQDFVNGKPAEGPAKEPELTLDDTPMKESAIIKELQEAAAAPASAATTANEGGGKRRTRGGRKRSDKKKKRKKTKKKDKKKKKRKTSKK